MANEVDIRKVSNVMGAQWKSLAVLKIGTIIIIASTMGIGYCERQVFKIVN